MHLPDNQQPIFLQLALAIEDAVIEGIFAEEEQVPSIVEFATTYRINPNTALKGVNKLVEDEILYKKRGIGMFVAKGAMHRLLLKRRKLFLEKYVDDLVTQAKQLQISLEQIHNMIKERYVQ